MISSFGSPRSSPQARSSCPSITPSAIPTCSHKACSIPSPASPTTSSAPCASKKRLVRDRTKQREPLFHGKGQIHQLAATFELEDHGIARLQCIEHGTEV